MAASAAICLGLLIPACGELPADEVLIRQFNEQRRFLDELVGLAQPQLLQIGTPYGAIEADDRTNAGKLMKQLHITSCGGRGDYMVFVCAQSCWDGEKGFYFIQPQNGKESNPPGLIVDSLDGSLPGKQTTFFRRLDENWFLFLFVPD